MKNVFLTMMMALAAYCGMAQSPVADPDTLKNPVKQIDPEVKQLPSDMYDAREFTRINADELPAAVLEKLKELEPSGWEKSVVYLEKRKNIYHVEVREDEANEDDDNGEGKHYRFDRNGEQLTDDKKDDGKKDQ